ncbi:MAG: 2-dehydro-3-deoxy-6-phosphogalactonate aldolase [Sphingomonadaceae bacterium]
MIAEQFEAAFAACPLVAILRGLTPDEAPAIGMELADAGFTLIEVPLNSPEPFESIRILADCLQGRAMVGAGTVLAPDEVAQLAAANGQFVVSPNVNPAVIEATVSAGMASLPGYYTVSEAFAALASGANALKLFPADGAPPAMLKAQRAVLPRDTRILAVGGISETTMQQWRNAGADGFGLGSNLYKSGKDPTQVAADAKALVRAVRTLS